MKANFFLLATLILYSAGLKAQEEKSPTAQYLQKWGYIFPDSSISNDTINKWPDTLYFNTVYTSPLLGSPTIPISFSRIELVDGKYEVSPTISLGFGYAWFKGSFIFNETDKITVDPRLFFGVLADVSLQNDFKLDKLAGFFTGVFIGFGSFNLFMGYDYVTQSPSVGIGGRIDVYTFRQQSLKPIGKVRELRKHKRVAVIIENE